MRTVREFERAGAAMIQLEDQTFPKSLRSFGWKGRHPSSMRCKASCMRHLTPDSIPTTLILARTDALAVEGLDAALERAEAYLSCGVDALFIEALRTPEDMRRACAQFAHRVPLLANMVEGGKTPIHSAQALGEVGFKLVIFPGGTARAVVHTLQGYYDSLRQHQTTAPWQDRMLDFDGLNAVIETPALLATGKKYA